MKARLRESRELMSQAVSSQPGTDEEDTVTSDHSGSEKANVDAPKPEAPADLPAKKPSRSGN